MSRDFIIKIEMQNYALLIRKHAHELGYTFTGFTDLNLSSNDKKNLEQYAAQDLGNMQWFKKHINLRKYPQKIFPQAKGAIVLGSYYRDRESEEVLKTSPIRIARYAHGSDYHKLLRKKGKNLLKQLQNDIPHLLGRICVDSAPVSEKILARMANLGWQGKHTNLIHPDYGSYFFLSVILVNIAFPKVKSEHPDLCKDCRLCIDACPTQALSEEKPYRIEPKRCISYQTIEHKEALNLVQLSATNMRNFDKWVFGCDICQEVCPYNRNRRTRTIHTNEAQFHLRATTCKLMQTAKLDPAFWDEATQGTALRRVSETKMQENIEFVKRG